MSAKKTINRVLISHKFQSTNFLKAIYIHPFVLKLKQHLFSFFILLFNLDGQTLPINRRQRAYNNGTLIIEQLQRLEDAGTYTCMAQNKQKQTSRRNVEIQVLGKC